jgi:DNA-binding CsgD family transcriptional regulator
VERGETLSRSDYRGILRVLEACEAAASLSELLRVAAASSCEELGFAAASFVLTTSIDGGRPRAHRIEHVGRDFPMDEYFERWVHLDCFHSPEAIASLRLTGTAQVSDLAPRMNDSRRRYVEDFLIPRRVQNQTTVWLPTGRGIDGYLTPLNDPEDPFGERDRAVLLALRPHLTYLLCSFLPPSASPAAAVSGLSAREAEVADLVALGYSNRSIADTLGLSESTAKKHVSNALAKTGAGNRTELAGILRSRPPGSS